MELKRQLARAVSGNILARQTPQAHSDPPKLGHYVPQAP